MKTYLFLLLFVFQAFSLSSQISLKGYNQEKIDPSLFEGRWKARWISYPGEAPNVYGDRKSTRLNSSHTRPSRMPSSA